MKAQVKNERAAVSPGDLAAALVRRKAEERRQFAARAAELRGAAASAVSAAIMSGKAQRAWLIGSLAWGLFGARSDIDVVVEGVKPTEAARLWDWLCRRLNADVHLLRIEDLPTPFRERVLQEGVPLHVT